MLSGYVASFLQLAAARVGLGIGEAAAAPAAHSMISDLFPKDRRSAPLEERVLVAFRDTLMRRDLFEEFCREYLRELNRLRMEHRASISNGRTELAGVDREIRKLIQAIKDGLPALSIKDELLALESRKAQLQSRLEASEMPELLHPRMADVYREKVGSLCLALENEETCANCLMVSRICWSRMRRSVTTMIESKMAASSFFRPIIWCASQAMEFDFPLPCVKSEDKRRPISLRSFDEDDIRFVPGPIEEQLAAVRGNIEITDRKTAAERRELPLASSLEITDPELLVGDIPLQHHQRIIPAEKRDASRAANQDELRQRIRGPIRRDGLQRKGGPHIST